MEDLCKKQINEFEKIEKGVKGMERKGWEVERVKKNMTKKYG